MGLVADLLLPCPRAVDDDTATESSSTHHKSEVQRGLTASKCQSHY